MSYTETTATAEVRNRLNEQTAVFWTDAELLGWLREGTTILATDGLLIEDSQDVTLVQNQLSYASGDEAWIANILKVHSCYYDDGAYAYNGLIKIKPKMLGHLETNTAGVPRYYCVFNKSIYVWPVPSAAVATKAITVLHAKLSSDIADLQDEYQHLPIIYSTAMAKVKDRKFNEAQLLMTLFLNALNFERSDKYDREVDVLSNFAIPKTVPKE